MPSQNKLEKKMIQNGIAKITDSVGKLTIEMPMKKDIKILIMAGLCFLALIQVLAFGDSLFKNSDPNFYIFWLIGFLPMCLLIIWAAIWTYFGKEVIEIENGVMRFDRLIFNFGKELSLEITEISNFRFEIVEKSRNSFFDLLGFSKGKIVFDYGMKTYSCGRTLDDSEARHIVGILQNFMLKNK